MVAFKRRGKGPGQEQDGNSQCEGGEPDWDYKELELELTGDLIVEIVTKCGRFSTTHVTILDPTARLSACDPRLHSYRHIKDIGQTNGQIMLKLHCDQKV